MYLSACTIRQGVMANADAEVPMVKLALNWTAPYIVPAVRPGSSTETPEDSPLDDNLPCWNPPSDLLNEDDRQRVANKGPMPCSSPHDSSDMMNSYRRN